MKQFTWNGSVPNLSFVTGESGDYVENGFDIFADVPSDGEDCENVFHFGERPIVPSYCPIHNYNR